MLHYRPVKVVQFFTFFLTFNEIEKNIYLNLKIVTVAPLVSIVSVQSPQIYRTLD